MYDAAVLAESSSDWGKAVKKWKECMNETLKQTEECRAQCVMASRVIPEEPDTVQGIYERAAGKKNMFIYQVYKVIAANNIRLFQGTVKLNNLNNIILFANNALVYKPNGFK